MSDETETMGEVARVLDLHASFKASAEIQDPNTPWYWECDGCDARLALSGTYGRPEVVAALAKHQAAMLAEAGLLRPQIAAPVPAGQPAAGSAGRGGSGGVGGALAGQCEKSPTCKLGPHGDEHPCGRPAEKPGEPCQFCGAPVPGPDVNDGACPNCWTPATISALKAGFAAEGLSVDLVPEHDSETNENEVPE